MINSRNYIAIPPGATIKEQLDNRGMTQKEFASRMEMSQKHISHLINGEVQLTMDVAMRLEMVLGLPARFWSNLEATYREELAKATAENEMDADIEIARNFPYKEMAAYGWVPDAKDKSEIVINLRKYFEVVRLELLNDSRLIPGIVYRRQNETEKSHYALLAWAQRAKLEARKMHTEPIDLKTLKNSLTEIRRMTLLAPEVFCSRLIALLANCGIALVFLPHIKGSYLHGATFYDSDKIVLGLTVRGKDADKFWFSLFHELGHILLGHIGKIDQADKSDEDNADSFARETLIPSDAFNKLTSFSVVTKEQLISFAKRMGIDVGIVVGRLQKEGYIPYGRFNEMKTQYEIRI